MRRHLLAAFVLVPAALFALAQTPLFRAARNVDWEKLAALGSGLQMFAIGNFFDDLLAERRNVVRLAAGDDVAVENHLLVNPVRPGILEIGFQRRP